MNSKELMSIILVVYLGVSTIICYGTQMFIISHITILLMGMMLGSAIVRNERELERWSRKKIKEGV